VSKTLKRSARKAHRRQGQPLHAASSHFPGCNFGSIDVIARSGGHNAYPRVENPHLSEDSVRTTSSDPRCPTGLVFPLKPVYLPIIAATSRKRLHFGAPQRDFDRWSRQQRIEPRTADRWVLASTWHVVGCPRPAPSSPNAMRPRAHRRPGHKRASRRRVGSSLSSVFCPQIGPTGSFPTQARPGICRHRRGFLRFHLRLDTSDRSGWLGFPLSKPADATYDDVRFYMSARPDIGIGTVSLAAPQGSCTGAPRRHGCRSDAAILLETADKQRTRIYTPCMRGKRVLHFIRSTVIPSSQSFSPLGANNILTHNSTAWTFATSSPASQHERQLPVAPG